MGDVGRTLFGGPEESDSASVSDNRNFKLITDAFKGSLGATGSAVGGIGGLLGLNGEAAQTGALNNFANSGGMSFLREQGNNQIQSSQAAKGLLRSGSTLKAMEKYGQGLGSTYLNQYMDHAMNLGKLGLGAGGLVSDAGKYSKSESDSQGKKNGIVPTIAAGFI